MRPNLFCGGGRFDQEMRDTRGRLFKGRLIGVSESNPTNMKPVNRLLRVTPPCFLKPRDIIFAPDQRRYLLAASPEFNSPVGITAVTFKALLLDKHLTVSRQTATTDAFTGLEVKSSGPVVVDSVWMQMEPLDQKLDRSSHISMKYERWTVYTAFDLQPGDIIDGQYHVTSVEELSGVTMAKVQ